MMRTAKRVHQGWLGGLAIAALSVLAFVNSASLPAAPVEATAAPTSGPEIAATTEPDPLATEVDQLLQDLDNLNHAADPLDDEP